MRMLANEIAELESCVMNMSHQARVQGDNIFGSVPEKNVESGLDAEPVGDLDSLYYQINRLREAITNLQSQINRFSDL